MHSFLPECFHPNFIDFCHVSLCNGRLQSSSVFGTSGVCHTPHLETSEVVFPEDSDLSTRISCRSTYRIYFGSLPRVRLTPPSLLLLSFLISSNLEDFLSVQRPRPLLLLRVRLLDFVCMPESAISSELDPLEDFAFPHIPCVSGISSNSDRRSTTIDGSQKLRGSNMRALYQRVRPPQFGKCSLNLVLTGGVDLLARRD
jgi:hypothetical protein